MRNASILCAPNTATDTAMIDTIPGDTTVIVEAPPTVAEAHAAIVTHLADHYAFYGEMSGARIARKHLGWYTKDLSGGDTFRREINAAETAETQLSAVHRFFATLAIQSERLDYRAASADIVDARDAFGRAPQASHRGGEALAA